jgi:transposase
VASHRRLRVQGGHRTVASHLPRAHRDDAEWTPQRLIPWAQGRGVATARGVETSLASQPHPQQGFRSCLGMMRLGKRDGTDLEAACRRALKIGACSYKSMDSILKHGFDQTPLAPAATPLSPPRHDHIRGPQDDPPTQGDPSCAAIRLSTNSTS